MSRVCVKNLPKYVTEDRLREFFSQKGEITDARLMRTRDGKSRQFGFIGYRTEHEAEESIKYFNNSYLDTCRITCEIASKVGDPNIPRTWSRHSVNKQDNGKEAEKDSGLDASKVGRKNVIEDDPKLQEFLQVTQSRIKSKLWENDMLIAPMADENGKVHERLNSATEHRERLVSVDHELSETAQIDHKHSDTHETKRSQDLAYDNVISDIDYFKSRMKKEWSESESSDDENNLKEAMDEAESLEESVEAHGKALFHNDAQGLVPSKDADANLLDVEKPFPSPKERGLEACRLFVRNLPYTATLEELEEYFSKVGNVSQVHLVVDKQTNRSKGIAFVLYMLPECATRALEELDGTSFQGRLLHVMPAQPKNPSGNHELLADDSKSQASKSFKQKREDERKAAEASGDTRAWNSFFMRHDTVVENIARIYGVSKGEFLDGEADNLAVRQALGQTQVVAMTKKAFANAGVNVESLEEFATGKTKHMKRSNHVLLVKNLPYASSEAELAKMFGKFGSLDKIIVPPTKTLALVVFLEPSEARAAFKGLAYRRYLDGPLYLEWAPVNVLSQSSTFDNKSGKGNAVVGEEDAKRVILEQTLEEILDVDVDPDQVESRSLFVKNLNFKTTEDTVRTHFSQHMKEGRILSVKVKKHLKNGKNVSMGFGFVEFDSMDIATNVATDLQGTVLDGHALILQLCQAKKDGRVQKKVDKDKSSTKLLVRNVAFEATEKDLRQLFSPFGQIKSLRLPMKFGNHRGFAFVEYVTKQEAQNALQALSSTHLYGRHLVLERAKEGESLEELRARTAAQFTDEQNGFQNPRKLKKRKFGSITE